MILGVVLAGGQSTRFGSDKALAELDGQTLIDLAVERLAGWCGNVVIAGRPAGPVMCISDWPRQGMGPLGGIAAGLRLAQDRGVAEILTIPVDALGLPDELPAMLGAGPSHAASQPVIGRWPVATLTALEAILDGDGRHSLYAFAETVGASAVELRGTVRNINQPEELPG